MAEQAGQIFASNLGNKPLGKVDVKLPNMMLTSGFRSPSMMIIPCKTIQDLRPPARVSNVDPMSGFKSYTLGHGDKITKQNAMFSFPNIHPLNNKLPKLAPTFFVK